MSPRDRAFHEKLLRLLRGIVNLYEEWINERLAEGSKTT